MNYATYFEELLHYQNENIKTVAQSILSEFYFCYEQVI
jgi:hypothetical protein